MESFDWKYYLDNNEDLVENGISTLEDAYLHWETFGKNENRKHKWIKSYILEKYFNKFVSYEKSGYLNKIDAWDLLNDIYYQNNIIEDEFDEDIELDNFDWKYYIDKNIDLKNSGILTTIYKESL